jgi:serine/threonine protein phosphatase PrpC
MTVYSYSGKGNRETNEDYIRSVQFENNASLHVVADGMGGYLYGEIAAQVATDVIVEYISEMYSDGNITSTIQQAIEFANEEIVLKRKALHAKLGTTIAGVFIRESVAYAFWLGDVQIQHFRDNKQLFISENHSLINEMKNNGVVSGKDIERYKNIVTKSLSGTPLEESIPIVEIQLQQGDIICISSDGLYNSVNPANLISKSDIETESILKLNEESNEDNFSIIKLNIKI